jgi:hypothetical protein
MPHTPLQVIVASMSRCVEPFHTERLSVCAAFNAATVALGSFCAVGGRSCYIVCGDLCWCSKAHHAIFLPTPRAAHPARDAQSQHFLLCLQVISLP